MITVILRFKHTTLHYFFNNKYFHKYYIFSVRDKTLDLPISFPKKLMSVHNCIKWDADIMRSGVYCLFSGNKRSCECTRRAALLSQCGVPTAGQGRPRQGFRIVCKIFWKRHFIRRISRAVRLIGGRLRVQIISSLRYCTAPRTNQPCRAVSDRGMVTFYYTGKSHVT